MNESERAARVMLGELDQPDTDMRDLLADLRTDKWNRLSPGEAIVVDLAFQLWGGLGGCTTLAEALAKLDEENLRHLVEAIAIMRPDVVNRVVLPVE